VEGSEFETRGELRGTCEIAIICVNQPKPSLRLGRSIANDQRREKEGELCGEKYSDLAVLGAGSRYCSRPCSCSEAEVKSGKERFEGIFFFSPSLFFSAGLRTPVDHWFSSVLRCTAVASGYNALSCRPWLREREKRTLSSLRSFRPTKSG